MTRLKTSLVVGRNRQRPVKDYGKSPRKQLTIPDQAISLREIITRFTRGVPVDVRQREAVYIDQSEFDLEALGRAEFSEKMSIAEELRAKYDAQLEALEQRREAKRKEEEEAKIRASIKAKEVQERPVEPAKA